MAKLKIFLLFVILSMFSARAETFENLIEYLPPEKEPGFWGAFDYFTAKTNDVLGGVAGTLDGYNKGKLDDMLSSLKGTVGVFVKHREDHAQLLAAEIKAAEKALAANDNASTRLVLAETYRRAGKFDLCFATLEPLIPAGKLVDVKNPAETFEVFSVLNSAYYDAYRNDALQSAVEALGELASAPGADIVMRMKASEAREKYLARIGDYRSAYKEVDKTLQEYMALSPQDMARVNGIAQILLIDAATYANALGNYAVTLAMMDENPDWPDPDMTARELLLLAEARSKSGENGKAFAALEKAGRVIHDAHPDGSEIEMEYLITAADLVRKNYSLSKTDRVSNRYTDKGVLYYANGARLLARNIWGENNQYVRRTNRGVALSAVLDYISKVEKSKEYSAPSTEKALAVLAGKATYTQSEKDYLTIVEESKKSLRLAKRVYEDELSFMRQRLHDDFATMSEGQRAEYMAHMSELVNDIYNFAEIDRGKATAKMVYDACLLSKSMLMAYSRSVAGMVKNSGDADLNERHNQLVEMKSKLVALEHDGNHSEAAAMRNKIDAHERDLLKALAAKFDIGRFISSDYKDVKKGLDKKSAAVEFYSYTDNLYGRPGANERMVVLAGSKDPEIVRLTYPAGAIDISENWRLKGLYTQIWQPLLKKKFIKPGYTVYFSPSGRWNGVPLEYLPGEDGRSMSDAYTMVRVSTTRELPRLSQADLSSPVLFGGLDYNLSADDAAEIREDLIASEFRGMLPSGLWNKLPGSAKEVDMIGACLTDGSVDYKIIKGEEGIEESFKALSGHKHGIIHIATHGYFMQPQSDGNVLSQAAVIDEALDNSGLVFSGANRFLVEGKSDNGLDDGHLTAREIALLDLSETDLVVLSACDTGVGRYTSEGVLGLQRGFKLAGVNTIVMSLWKVNDAAAATMMNEFYKNIIGGMDKRSAFFKAREVLRKGAYPGPDGKTIPGTSTLIGDAFVILD